MIETAMISPAEVYARIAEAVATDTELETALINDLDGTLKSRFGITMPGHAALARSGDGFRLDWNGRTYEVSDPRKVDRAELNDAELELVSGGGNDCPYSNPNAGLMTGQQVTPPGTHI